MKNLFFAMFFFLLSGLLAGCPQQEEVQEIKKDLAAKRANAVQFIEAKDYSLANLLKIQDYFFSFSEKVHLLSQDEAALKKIQAVVKKNAKEFCESFVLPISHWEKLDSYCRAGSFYKCSQEIQMYPMILRRLYFFSSSSVDICSTSKRDIVNR